MIPVGDELTVPDPVTATLNMNCALLTGLKLAVTLLAAFIDTVHVVVLPMHAPPHALKTYPAAGAAARATLVPALKFALHAVLQLIPEGDDVTLPDPVTETFNANVPVLAGTKFAVTLLAAFMVNVQVAAFPLHAPLQLLKT